MVPGRHTPHWSSRTTLRSRGSLHHSQWPLRTDMLRNGQQWPLGSVGHAHAKGWLLDTTARIVRLTTWESLTLDSLTWLAYRRIVSRSADARTGRWNRTVTAALWFEGAYVPHGRTVPLAVATSTSNSASHCTTEVRGKWSPATR